MKENNSHNKTKLMVLTGLFIALGIILPFFTGQFRRIGKMLLPMHIPVMLCGLVCGPSYGLICGIVTPILRSLLFGMPVLFPSAAAMSFELSAYGFILGALYKRSNNSKVISLYINLIISMLSGRVIWGIIMCIFMLVKGSTFTFGMFITGAFADAFPGIILQLILIPSVMALLHKAGFKNRN